MGLIVECSQTECIGVDKKAVTCRILYKQGLACKYGRIILAVIIGIFAKGVNLILIVVYYDIAESFHLT